MAVVLAAVFVAVLGCRRKPAQAAAASAPSGGSFASYAGTWKGYMTKTAETAACKAETDGTLLGPEVVIVTGTGAFSGATGEYSGVISRSGQVTGTFTSRPERDRSCYQLLALRRRDGATASARAAHRR